MLGVSARYASPPFTGSALTISGSSTAVGGAFGDSGSIVEIPASFLHSSSIDVFSNGKGRTSGTTVVSFFGMIGVGGKGDGVGIRNE